MNSIQTRAQIADQNSRSPIIKQNRVTTNSPANSGLINCSALTMNPLDDARDEHGVAPKEPKPQHSYSALIAKAILSSPEEKLPLSGIYQYIIDNYPYYRYRNNALINSIHHTLYRNRCFFKVYEHTLNGKRQFWMIDPWNIANFKKRSFGAL